MSSAQLYDTIGATYTVTRRTEPRIAAQVWAAIGVARTVLNVGAGTGSYEPSDRDVTAVEPSAVMRAQRPAGATPCVVATAEGLPFRDQSFDAAMAFSTTHHWRDPIAGLLEMRRVARRVVVFTCDTSDRSWRHRFWLTRDYLPEVAFLVVGRAFADRAGLRDWSPRRAGAYPVGLRLRLRRGLLASARGILGRQCPARDINLGQRRARGPAESGGKPRR
jgi:ubiquinone/menaquinone biosynthesis C-methylase UbiE